MPALLSLGLYVLYVDASAVEKAATFYRRLRFQATGFNVSTETRTLVPLEASERVLPDGLPDVWCERRGFAVAETNMADA